MRYYCSRRFVSDFQRTFHLICHPSLRGDQRMCNGMHGQCDPVLHSDFPHQLATAVTSGWLLPFPKTEQKRISVILQGGKRYCETKAAVLGCSDRWKGTTRLGENRARRRDISHLGSPTCPPEQARAMLAARELPEGPVMKQLLEWIAGVENRRSGKK